MRDFEGNDSVQLKVPRSPYGAEGSAADHFQEHKTAKPSQLIYGTFLCGTPHSEGATTGTAN